MLPREGRELTKQQNATVASQGALPRNGWMGGKVADWHSCFDILHHLNIEDVVNLEDEMKRYWEEFQHSIPRS